MTSERLALLRDLVWAFRPAREPARSQDREIQIGLFDECSGIAVGIEDAPILLTGNLAIDAHGAYEDQPLQSRFVHRVDDGASLARQIARKVRVDNVLALHGVSERRWIQHIALDDGDTLRRRVAQPTGPTQVERQGDLAIGEEDPCRVAGDAR
jgi:hypothetical protein